MFYGREMSVKHCGPTRLFIKIVFMIISYLNNWPFVNDLSHEILLKPTHDYTGVGQTFRNIIIFTNPSARAGYDTRSIFKQSLTGLNSEFSFS